LLGDDTGRGALVVMTCGDKVGAVDVGDFVGLMVGLGVVGVDVGELVSMGVGIQIFGPSPQL